MKTDERPLARIVTRDHTPGKVTARYECPHCHYVTGVTPRLRAGDVQCGNCGNEYRVPHVA